MQIDLSPADAAVVRELLTARLGDLSVEIAATDNPAYRQMLRERRNAVRRVADALSPVPTPTRGL
jgi:hypothetical protein